jgi:hypothetical protein
VWFREGSLWWWCRLNASVSAREGRRHDKALPKDEPEAAMLSWLNEKEA